MKYLYTFVVAYVLCFMVGVFVVWFKSPELTYMQVFLVVWPYWLIAVALVLATGISLDRRKT